jgi:GLPGLI family protein
MPIATVFSQQRTVAECTIYYDNVIPAGAEKGTTEVIHKTVYIKGNNSRVNVSSPSYQISTIIDQSTGKVVVLRSFGNNKYMTVLTKAQWVEANKKFEGMKFIPLNDTKSILGYNCKNAQLLLKDSSVYNIYYTTAIVPSVKDFEYEFKDVPGFVLEYEATDNNGNKIHFLANKISFDPVLLSEFEIPTKGYRIINWK